MLNRRTQTTESISKKPNRPREILTENRIFKITYLVRFYQIYVGSETNETLFQNGNDVCFFFK